MTGQPPASPPLFGFAGDPRQWVRAANEIAARVSDGRYPPGQWLPRITDIADDLGLSAAPVRQGLAEASGNGLVTYVRYRGYYAGNGSLPPDCRPAKPRRQPGPGQQSPQLPGSLARASRRPAGRGTAPPAAYTPAAGRGQPCRSTGGEHLFGSCGIPWCGGAGPVGDVGGPVAADAAGPVDGGLDVGAEQAGRSRKFLTMRAVSRHRRWS
ncbi:MAG: Bacterial regulatory protein gntR family [Actinomycetia bacterium]|nr:Bacterial regulatory protein gntR family [Actinomycetes bacterium]